MILEVVQPKWLFTWYDPLGPWMCVLVKPKAHFHDKRTTFRHYCPTNLKETNSNRSNRGSLIGHHRMANLLPLISVKKCRVDIQKLNFNKSLKSSNLSKEEWTAHQNLKTRDDIVIKPADKGGAVVVWRTDLYKQKAFRQLADTKHLHFTSNRNPQT